MELHILRYFLVVANELNISKAAEILHITQPTLSRQIASLESELGVSLFHRQNKRITLTEEGFHLKQRASELLELEKKTIREIKSTDSIDVEGTISIGCVVCASGITLARILSDFRAQYPKVKIDIHTATADIISEKLEHGIYDFGLMLDFTKPDSFQYVQTPDIERWVVLMNADDPLTCKSTLTKEDLINKNLCLPESPAIEKRLLHWLGKEKNELSLPFTCDFYANSAIYALYNDCYSFVLEGMLPHWDVQNLAYLPLYPPLEDRCIIAWKKNAMPGKAAAKFIEHLSSMP